MIEDVFLSQFEFSTNLKMSINSQRNYFGWLNASTILHEWILIYSPDMSYLPKTIRGPKIRIIVSYVNDGM